MCYLLKTKYDYILCYGKPAKPYVIIPSKGQYFFPEYFKSILEEEEDSGNLYFSEDDYAIIDAWADVVSNDHGVIVSEKIAEYLLQGRVLQEDTFIPISPIVEL